MNVNQMFEAVNGIWFKTEAECLRYEAVLARVNECRGMLRTAVDDTCGFSNGEGYVQQSSIAVAKFDAALVELLETYFDPQYPDTKLSEMYRQCPFGIVGRYLDDGGDPFSNLLYALWGRRSNIDDANREWGQPYYTGRGRNPWKYSAMPGEWSKIKEATVE